MKKNDLLVIVVTMIVVISIGIVIDLGVFSGVDAVVGNAYQFGNSNTASNKIGNSLEMNTEKSVSEIEGFSILKQSKKLLGLGENYDCITEKTKKAQEAELLKEELLIAQASIIKKYGTIQQASWLGDLLIDNGISENIVKILEKLSNTKLAEKILNYISAEDIGGWASEQEFFGSFLPGHGFAVTKGMGFSLANPSPASLKLDEPNILLYAPDDIKTPFGGKKWGSFKDNLPDGPYTLIGWGYWLDYDPDNRPEMSYVLADEWLMHEAGFHLSDGDMVVTKPNENNLGEANPNKPKKSDYSSELTSVLPQAPIFTHARMWDLHMFRGDLLGEEDDVPVISKFIPDSSLLPSETLDISSVFSYVEDIDKEESACD